MANGLLLRLAASVAGKDRARRQYEVDDTSIQVDRGKGTRREHLLGERMDVALVENVLDGNVQDR